MFVGVPRPRCAKTLSRPTCGILPRGGREGTLFTELNDEIQERLTECRKGGEVQALLRRYLLEVQQVDARIRIVPADGQSDWTDVDVLLEDQRVARVFPKSAVVQVENRTPNSKPGDYGPKLELYPSGRWRVAVRSKDDVAELLRCTSDAIINADGQRVFSPEQDAHADS